MCAINGIFAYHYAANPISHGELIKTRDYMAARGPDGKGEWVSESGRVGFGHRRLAIIDLSEAGSQPMASADQSLVITFNGEIYNFRELRRGLEAKGYVFRSSSDTEVLLCLYADKGRDMVHDLRGMFAFAIWDDRRQELFLARDPYGIKPLYYSDDGWTFRFASQVKALVAGGAVSKEYDPAGQVGFFLLGSVPEPFTLFRAIRMLPAGSTMTVDRLGAHEPRNYYSVARIYVDAERGAVNRGRAAEAVQEIGEALLDSVRHHVVADVPVSAFLSGGIDSSALVGLMRDASVTGISTVTLAFEEFKQSNDDEAPVASRVAQHYGTRHTTRLVTAAEFETDLPRILDAMDQPSIDGINMWFVAKAARELGLKVALSGVGGDELFGGYPSFVDIPRSVRVTRIPGAVPLLGKAIRAITMGVVSRVGLSPKAAGLLEYGSNFEGAYLLRRGLYMPWELNTVLPSDVVAEGLRRLRIRSLIAKELRPCPLGTRARVATLESALYLKNQLLRDADWASMAHSIEVRTPLVDSVLLSQVAKIGACQTSAVSKTSLAVAPSRRVPIEVARRSKTGFSTPIAVWQRKAAVASIGPRQVRGRTSSSLPWARQWASTVLTA